jgi:hypothetical protein
MKLVHYSKRPLDVLERREQVAYELKPAGLWVSDDDCHPNWPDYCGRDCGRDLLCVHDVGLANDANILFLRSTKGVEAFAREWSERMRIGKVDTGVERIRWDKVAERYDGMIITPYRKLRQNRSFEHSCRTVWYLAWDCASGCIWEPRAIASVALR